ncbi:uncharacterized protein LOC135113854 [Scylla paramamosain]|uniref:uncharacterized protein LOC135113854 n=1 Tax=Scylla paramamosain TaxID=85552 RepID=UPI0030827AFA
MSKSDPAGPTSPSPTLEHKERRLSQQQLRQHRDKAVREAMEEASPHAILDTLVRKWVRGRLLAWLHDYLQHRRARVRFQGLRSSFKEFENGTPQAGILSPLLFNLLMEQLVALPFHAGTVLLSYADDLALVVTGRGNKLRRTQQALDLISGKCQDLGLKISAEKSRAMMVKAADPAWQLRVQGVELAWTNSYQYLGVWVDKRLSFTAHAAYLRERTQARLNEMRVMTGLTAAATFSVLRRYYVQTVRSLVDYSAPVLIALSPNQERIEVLQNTAMRTMLGSPRWSSACVMQSETNLVPLTTRVQQIMAYRVARVQQRDAEGVTQRKPRLAGTQGVESLRRNPWLLQCTLAAHNLAYMEDCGRTGAAAITRGAEVCERTPDHCSTLQTELVAIHLALEYAQHRPERSVVFHIDSITVLQALEQPYSSDNVGLVTIVLGSLQSLAAQARLVRFIWIPSHVEVRGNEAAGDGEGASQARRNPRNPARPPHTPRVRLGYCTREQLYDGYQGQECENCGRHSRHLLVHYLLSCPATAALRSTPLPAAHPVGGGLLSSREVKTALLRHTPTDLMLQGPFGPATLIQAVVTPCSAPDPFFIAATTWGQPPYIASCAV